MMITLITGYRGTGKTIELAKLSRENKIPLIVNYKHQLINFKNNRPPECYRFHEVMTIDGCLSNYPKNYKTVCIDDIEQFLCKLLNVENVVFTLNSHSTKLIECNYNEKEEL